MVEQGSTVQVLAHAVSGLGFDRGHQKLFQHLTQQSWLISLAGRNDTRWESWQFTHWSDYRAQIIKPRLNWQSKLWLFLIVI